jgi:peptidoglycan/xylan/chitin deacetylase (PgdA/CDA1 family)
MARTFVSHVLDGTGAFAALLKLRNHTPTPWLTVLTYHRIAHPLSASAIDDGVVDARPEAFERQLLFLKRHCNVITLDDLIEFRNGRPLPPNPVLVTFDDGYKDNHDVALPILARHGIKAVFFIATSYLAERRLFWWDKVSWLLKRSTRETLELEYPKKLTIAMGRSRAERSRAVRATLAVIKSHYGLDVARYLEEVERASGVSLPRELEVRMTDELLMSWDDVRALRRAGMSVQSHTRNHRTLHTLSSKELVDELAGSREELEGVLGERVRAVAYPVGKGLQCAPHARNAIRAAGYELGFSNGTGINHVWRFDPLDVKRLSLEVDVPDSYFHGMVALPYFAYEHHGIRRS